MGTDISADSSLRGKVRQRTGAMRRRVLLPLGLIAATAMACGGYAIDTAVSAASPQADPGTFYFISHGCPTDPFWPPVWNGAADAGRQLGIRVDILHITSSECGSTAAEVNLLETAIAAHPAGIATTITDPTAFGSALQTAAKDNIPVVVFNSAPTASGAPSATNPFLSYIGQQNYSAGQGLANEAVTDFSLTKGATVVVVDHEPTNISLTQRLQGVKSAFGAHGITPAVVNTSDDISQGATVVSGYLTNHKNVAAILTLGTTGTDEVAEAQATSGTHIKVGAMDLDSTTLSYIEHGTVSYTVDQQPYLQGYLSIVELFLDATEGAAPVNIPTGPAFITSANVKMLAKYVDHTGF
ncbi:MAG TPA: substrate-binding domain-containing protein [Acidimicrobiales bacterium]|nr:substrate-binding domain-containing protein [Acidimicrobiales bacterium]